MDIWSVVFLLGGCLLFASGCFLIGWAFGFCHMVKQIQRAGHKVVNGEIIWKSNPL